ncbi:hypothetical protein CW304_18925 [Bacillus sp. UFRGS-B20]|nr:hypothetical protein CW304_18925 [Bacillus sp. UFRGS-B20]
MFVSNQKSSNFSLKNSTRYMTDQILIRSICHFAVDILFFFLHPYISCNVREKNKENVSLQHLNSHVSSHP